MRSTPGVMWKRSGMNTAVSTAVPSSVAIALRCVVPFLTFGFGAIPRVSFEVKRTDTLERREAARPWPPLCYSRLDTGRNQALFTTLGDRVGFRHGGSGD